MYVVMNRASSKAFVLAVLFASAVVARSASQPRGDTVPTDSSATNLAASATAVASSQRSDTYSAAKAIDGVVSDASRWMNAQKLGPHTLELTLSARFEIASAHVYSGWEDGSALSEFSLEYWDNDAWKPIPGARVEANPSSQTALQLMFEQPVTTTRIRLVSNVDGYVRLRELSLFGPTPDGRPPVGTGVKMAADDAQAAGPDLAKHHVLANQIGYNQAWSKRFTAPNSPDGSQFVVRPATGRPALFKGVVENHLGDFTPLENAGDQELVIEVDGQGKEPGASFPFRIEPLLIHRSALDPALRFMIDCRSVVGTHPSAYGGHPWRDGTYYTFETPSLVLMYLANPAFFEAAEMEIDYAAERDRVLDPQFKLVKTPNDGDALDATRRYYQELDPPVGDAIPDLVQLLHWGIGYQLMDPVNGDPSGDPLGAKMHPQTVEQFAFFLYGFPHYQQYFTDKFHRKAMEFAFANWKKVGLLNILTEIGDFKGRECPGHSIAPNLMMYEVAKRHNRSDADVYLKAAVDQAHWFVANIDASDPRISRGQRLSEHKPILGLFLMHTQHPEHAPAGLNDWLAHWVETVLARSDNMYDFRKFDDVLWTLPKPWSDPGSVAGFPGIAVMVKSTLAEQQKQHRLDELKASHFDTLFGRNPVNAASANRAADAFPGLDRGWPHKYGDDICARLELCRGTLNTIAAHEHYPFKPHARFRHPEGWSGFNAAFNVSLAFCCWDDTQIVVESQEAGKSDSVAANEQLKVTVTAPASGSEELVVEVQLDGSDMRELVLQEVADSTYSAQTSLKQLGVEPGQNATLSYGHALFSKAVSLVSENSSNTWRIVSTHDTR